MCLHSKHKVCLFIQRRLNTLPILPAYKCSGVQMQRSSATYAAAAAAAAAAADVHVLSTTVLVVLLLLLLFGLHMN